VRTFRDLKVWQKAHQLALAVYRETVSFPKHEVYGLTSQLRRASVSTPTNIVEGSRLSYLSPATSKELSALADEIGTMLHAFIAGLNSDR
jgi:hypothetical protein